MNLINLFNRMLLSIVLLGIWWACYRLALRQERSFAYNRVFLVLGPLLAAGLPLLPLAWPMGWNPLVLVLPNAAVVLLPTVRVGAPGPAGIDWLFWLRMTYLAGAVFMLARLAHGLGQLWRNARALPRSPRPGYTLVETHGRLPISSFGPLVFWDETLPLTPAEARQVLGHELAHVRQGHTYDRLLLELLRAVLWFNPFVHLCGRALGLTHEFLADEAALRDVAVAIPSTSYTHLLARQVASRLGFSVPLAHSFSHSQTLNRIAMIQKTNPIRRWKQWLVLPLLGVLLVAVACEKANTAFPPPPPPPPPIPQNVTAPATPSGVYSYVEQMPELTSGGGSAGIVVYIQQHLVYPNVSAGSQRTGRVFASFIVTDQGEVQAVKVLKGIGPAYDEAVVTAIRQLPRFVPGKQKGKAVNVSYTVPIQFATATLPDGPHVN